jgi:hypothetical protein
LLIANYRDFDVVLYCRAMNRAELFVDEALEVPLLAALGEQQYGCQAVALGASAAARLDGLTDDGRSFLRGRMPQWLRTVTRR